MPRGGATPAKAIVIPLVGQLTAPGQVDTADPAGLVDGTPVSFSMDSGGNARVVDKGANTLLASILAALGAALAVTITSPLPTGQNHIGRVTVDTLAGPITVGTISGSLAAGQNHIGRVAVDSILDNHFFIGHVGIDSIIGGTSMPLRAGFGHIGAVALDSVGAVGSRTAFNNILTGTSRVRTQDSLMTNFNHLGRVAVDSILASQNHIGRVTIDTLAVGRINTADSLTTSFAHAGRVAVDSILSNNTHIGRVTLDSIMFAGGSGNVIVGQHVTANSFSVAFASDITNMSHLGRFTVDSILASQNHVGRVAVDSILASMTHIGRVTVDSAVGGLNLDKSATLANVSLGDTTNKVMLSATGLPLTTTAVTANQTINSISPAAGKVFYLQSVMIQARLTTLSATASVLGTAGICFQASTTNCQTGSGTILVVDLVNGTTEVEDRVIYTFAEPLAFPTGNTLFCVTTPAATTSMSWRCNMIGYTK